MDFKMKGCWIENHPEYNRGFEAGEQSKQVQIDKALELLRQPMQGTVADLLSELENVLDDT